MCSNHARVSNQPQVTHTHIKGAAGNVASIELDVYGVDSILPWNEANCIFVCKHKDRDGDLAKLHTLKHGPYRSNVKFCDFFGLPLFCTVSTYHCPVQ